MLTSFTISPFFPNRDHANRPGCTIQITAWGREPGPSLLMPGPNSSFLSRTGGSSVIRRTTPKHWLPFDIPYPSENVNPRVTPLVCMSDRPSSTPVRLIIALIVFGVLLCAFGFFTDPYSRIFSQMLGGALIIGGIFILVWGLIQP